MSTLWKRMAALFRKGRLDNELEEEIFSHLSMQEEEFRARGMSAVEARLAARRAFGGVTQTVEAYRERRAVAWVDNTLKDLRYAVRGLVRNPGFTAAAVLSLALGIGANTAIFSLVRSLMLRMLPVTRPEQLVYFYRTGGWGKGFLSYPLYLDLAKRKDVFEGVAARTGVWRVRFSRPESPRVEFAQMEYVSGNYFSLLGVQPAIGRLIGESDNRTPKAHPLAVLSYEFWRNRFGGDAAVLGATVVVDSQPLTVVGVAAPGFRGVEVEHHPDVWVPCMMFDGKIMSPGMHWVWAVGRRRPGVSRERIQSVIDAVMQQYLTEQYGKNTDAAFRKSAFGQRLQVYGADAGISSLRFLFGKALLVLMATVGLVLMAACANLANLLLARGAARYREIALRFSLGATRARLVRQALTESLLLSLVGSGLGLGFAMWGQQAILGFLPSEVTEPFALAPDGTVLAFTIGISVLAAVLFGLAPAWRSTAVDPVAGLRGNDRRTVQRPVLRRALVVAQVALSVVLVSLAGLFGGSLARLRAVDVGFRHQNVLAFQLDCPAKWDRVKRQQVLDGFVDRVSRLPGVASVSYGFPGPFEMGMANASIRVPGSAATAVDSAEVAVATVAPRYFGTIGTRLLAGREFEEGDTGTSQKVAIVDETFVRRFFPGESAPIGRALSFDESKPEGGERTYIVGVVPDIRHDGLREPSKPTVYSPVTQTVAIGDPSVLVNAQAPPASAKQALRREMAKLSDEVVLTEPETIAQHIDDSIFQERILATLSGFFGVLALLLAAVGLYGVVAYGTMQRAREIGVRIALGARLGAILWMVLRDALLLVSVGLVVGLPSAMAAARAVRAVLDGVPAAGVAMFASTGAVLLAVGTVAALAPARRAARMDPMATLRQE
jgi:putative ABC transport system permease protein